MMDLLNQSNGYKYVLETLKETGYKWDKIEHLNQGRYTVVYGMNDYPNIAIQTKKAWFLKYGEMFEGKGGVGDTINSEQIKEYLQRGVQDIYTVYREGQIYKINLQKFCLESNVWQNKEGKRVRSISIHHYERVNNPISAIGHPSSEEAEKVSP